MIDTHLINIALVIFGTCAGVAVLISAAIIAVAAAMQHKAGMHGSLSGKRVGSGRAVRHEPALR